MNPSEDRHDSLLSLFLRHGLLKRVKRYSIIAGLSVIGLFFTLVGLGFLFEDEILDKVRLSVNEQLDVPVNVGQMDFSLLSHFPQASISFHDLSIPDRLDSTLFLVQAKELSLHFDIWDIVSGSYLIDKASLSHADLRMHTDAQGELNYIFWKSSEDSSTDIRFDLEEFKLDEVNYAYQDDALDLHVHAQVKRATLKVGVEDERIEIYSDLHIEKGNLNFDRTIYVEDRAIAYKGRMSISADGSDMRFDKSRFDVGSLALEMQGRIHQKKEGWMVDLDIATETQVQEVLLELPPSYRDEFTAYEAKGDLDLDLSVKGITGKGVYPLVKAQFELEKGQIGLKERKDRVDRIYAKGSYERDEKGRDLLTLNESRGELAAGHIAFRGKVKDLQAPYIDGKLDLNGALKDFLALIEESPLTKAKGDFQLSVDLKGKIPTAGFKPTDAVDLGMRGNVILNGIAFTLASDGYQVADLEGEILLKADDLLFDPLTFECNGTAMELSGSMTGMLAHMSDEKKHLVIKAKVYTSAVNWDQWVAAGTSQTPGEPSSLPQHVDLALEIDLDAFQYAHFKATQIKGSMALKGNTIQLDPISFQSCQGELLASLSFDQQQDKSWKLKGEGDIRHMDISELLREFDHFGQTFITDKQLKGKGDAHVSFRGAFNAQMEVDLASIIADADITLDNGELIEHPAMVDIINAMRDQKMTRSFVRIDELEKEMHHLKFKQLKNTIHIEQGRMVIPEMTIANNAMDVRIAGSHSFKNDIDYTVSFSMRDVLINKKNPEFLIQDDGLGHVLNMRMYGTVDEPIIEMDKGKAKENRKEAITQAKNDVKEFFKDPLGRRTDKVDTKHEILVEVEQGPSFTSSKQEEALKEDPKKKKWWNTPQPVEEVKKDPVIITDDDF